MAEGEMLMVYCYDVVRDRTRARIARLLEEMAVRVQQCVFEVRLDRNAARRLAERISLELEPEDSLRVYAVSQVGRSRCLTFGGPPLAEEQDFFLL